MKNRFLLLLSACAVSAAQAHVTLEYQAAPAGASYKASFKVGHGCGESATRQVVVDIPTGVRGAHPMPKPGWQLAVERATDDVARVTWTARSREDMLVSAHYDEFVLVARLPEQAGTLYWPVRQVCEEGRADWVEVPRPGQKPSELKSPAARLEVLPAGGGGAHVH
jgi:periplasmic copper chaperone A